MNEIEREVQKLKAHNPNVYLSSYIGFHPHVKNAFLNRVRETAANSEGQFDFDGGSYASAAH